MPWALMLDHAPGHACFYHEAGTSVHGSFDWLDLTLPTPFFMLPTETHFPPSTSSELVRKSGCKTAFLYVLLFLFCLTRKALLASRWKAYTATLIHEAVHTGSAVLHHGLPTFCSTIDVQGLCAFLPPVSATSQPQFRFTSSMFILPQQFEHFVTKIHSLITAFGLKLKTLLSVGLYHPIETQPQLRPDYYQ